MLILFHFYFVTNLGKNWRTYTYSWTPFPHASQHAFSWTTPPPLRLYVLYGWLHVIPSLKAIISFAGSFYDSHILDMIELGIMKYTPIAKFKVSCISLFSGSFFSFSEYLKSAIPLYCTVLLLSLNWGNKYLVCHLLKRQVFLSFRVAKIFEFLTS